MRRSLSAGTFDLILQVSRRWCAEEVDASPGGRRNAINRSSYPVGVLQSSTRVIGCRAQILLSSYNALPQRRLCKSAQAALTARPLVMNRAEKRLLYYVVTRAVRSNDGGIVLVREP